MPSDGEAGQRTPARDSSDQMPHVRPSRLVRPWQAAGVLSLAAALALGVYAFWPRLVGSADVGNDARVRNSDRVEVRAPVDVMVASATDLVLQADATGHLAPWRSADIGAGASGLVKERLVEEGSRVMAGDVLLRLDDRAETIALKEARGRVLEAQIRYADIRIGSAGRKDADTARISVAEGAFERARRAFETGSITPEEMRLARREFDAAVLRSGARRAEVETILSGLELAEQALERARLQLSRTTVRAPFTGLIADIVVEVGQHVGAGTTVMRLLDDSRMKVTVDVMEADLVDLRVEGSAGVRIPAIADTTVTGRVFSINPSVDPRTGTGRVTVDLSNPRGDLLSGLFAYVRIESGRLRNRIVVPDDALLVRQGRDLVFVVENGRAVWTYVTVGRRSGDQVEIVEPLVAGDSVAVAGHHALSHDAGVEVGQVVAPPELFP